MTITRREVMALIPGGLLLQSGFPDQAPLHSASYAFDELKAQTSNGVQTRAVLRGKTPTGNSFEVHETTLDPGAAPHPPHRGAASEMWLVREGTLEFSVNGTSHLLGPGSVGFAAADDERGVRNAGQIPTSYFVVSFSPRA